MNVNTTALAAFLRRQGAALHVCMQIKVHFGKWRQFSLSRWSTAPAGEVSEGVSYSKEESLKPSAQRFHSFRYHLFKSTSVVFDQSHSCEFALFALWRRVQRLKVVTGLLCSGYGSLSGPNVLKSVVMWKFLVPVFKGNYIQEGFLSCYGSKDQLSLCYQLYMMEY